MKTKAILTLGLALLPSGCVTHLDKETPPGTVPIAAAPAPEPALTSVRDEVPSSTDQSLPSNEQSQVSKAFTERYSNRNSPRIVVFLNRELSADVQEWHASARLVVEGKMKLDRSAVTASTDKASVAAAGQSSATIANGKDSGVNETKTIAEKSEREATRVAGGEMKVKGKDGKFYEQVKLPDDRPAPPETWMWQFETSFLAPFHEAKTILLDRATLMRLAASDTSKAELKGDGPNPKQIEIDALKGKADLLMEILVHKNQQSPVGYEFKVSVKEIATGRMLSNVSSLAWKQDKLKRLGGGKIVATPQGYKVSDDQFPKLERVAAVLAEDVMRTLTSVWSGG